MELKRIPKNTVTTREEHWCHLRNSKLIGVPQINSRWSTFPLHWIHSHLAFHIIYNKWLDILYNNPEIPWDTHLTSIGTSISVKQQDERPGHHILSGDESWFPVFNRRGQPSFHKHLKRSFPIGICMWEGPCVLFFKRNGPRDALLRKKYKFPCRGFMHAHCSYHKMKGCLIPLYKPYRKP